MRLTYLTQQKPRFWRFALSSFGAMAIAASGYAQATAPTPAASDEEEEDIVELSPFTITADDQTGYQAVSTLAGTRIKTDLKDVGSAITVVTKDFMEDTGTTNISDLLVYTTSTEVGGAFGNFAGPGAAAGDVNANNNARANPTGNNRVRGLSSASSTRDFFLTSMGFDGYNTEAVTISRGPNSILFGIGEPGGIIDNSLKKAIIGREITQLTGRFGSNKTYRGTLDINRDIIEDRLAVRVNAMHEDITYRQKPTYERDTRYYVALKGVLFENKNVDWLDPTIIRGSYEYAKIRGTPPDPIPPKDNFSHWFEPPGSVEADAITGKKPNNGWPDDWRENYAYKWVIDQVDRSQDTPGYKHMSQPELWGSNALIFANPRGGANIGFEGDSANVAAIYGAGGKFQLPDGRFTPGWWATFSTSQSGGFRYYGNGFQDHVIMDRNILDYEEVLLQGEAQFSNHSFDARNITLEQTFFNGKAGIELAWDDQKYHNDRFFPWGRHTYASIKIDTGKWLTNGKPNPNLGRPMMNGQYDPVNRSWNEKITKRVTAFYDLDLTEKEGFMRWLGRHTVTGLYSEWENDSWNFADALTWDTSHDQALHKNVGNSKPGGWGGRMFGWLYVGDGQWNANSPSEVRMYDTPLKVQLPKVGDFYEIEYLDKDAGEIKTGQLRVRSLNLWPGRTLQNVDSVGFTWQGRFLDNSLILTYGWRQDEAKTWQIDRIQNPDGSYLVEESWENFKNGGDPVLAEKGDTATKQAVFHIPARYTTKLPLKPTFSVHWSESENFNPASVRRSVYNDVFPSPNGETTEYGFTVNLMENKASLRFNWYETSSKSFTNPNMRNPWMFFWPRGMAQRWTNAKNASIPPPDADPNDPDFAKSYIKFEDIGFGNPELDGYPFPYDPTATGSFTSYDHVINTLINDVFPESTKQALNMRLEGELGKQTLASESIPGVTSVADLVSEGFEVEAVFNMTSSWRLAFNASKTESVFSNGLRTLIPFAEEVTANLKSTGLWGIYEGGARDTVRIGDRWTNETLAPLRGAQSKEGTVSTELRKWRFNAVTNYNFREGRLKGFGIGGAVRWQDKVSTGYPLERNEDGLLVPVLSNPFFGSSDFTGDLWFSYATKMWDDKVGVKFQLNLVNVLGSSDPMEVTTNPDGQVAIIRVAPEKRWFFTTTFDF